MKKNLVYDIGMHLGNDTKMYIEKGFQVVAIEANENLVKEGAKRFREKIIDKQLEIVNCAISEMDNQIIKFYISDLDQESSLSEQMAKNGGNVKSTEVISYTLPTLFKKYGVPYYCKIDIEGYDNFALNTLKGHPELLPKFISAEISNLSEDGVVSRLVENEEDLFKMWTSTLNILKELGYTKFKLVDQYSLEVFDKESKYLNSPLYFGNSFLRKLINKTLRSLTCLRFCLSLNKAYYQGCSGPFGNDLAGEWSDYEQTKDNIVKHTTKGLKHGKRMMWCDVHATT